MLKEVLEGPGSVAILVSVLPEPCDGQVSKGRPYLPALLPLKQAAGSESTVALSSAWIRNRSTCVKVPSKLVSECCRLLSFPL